MVYAIFIKVKLKLLLPLSKVISKSRYLSGTLQISKKILPRNFFLYNISLKVITEEFPRSTESRHLPELFENCF